MKCRTNSEKTNDVQDKDVQTNEVQDKDVQTNDVQDKDGYVDK